MTGTPPAGSPLAGYPPAEVDIGTVALDVAGTRVAVRACSVLDEPMTFFPSVGEYHLYDDVLYDALAERDGRYRAYRDAVRPVAPGRVVVDIGTGRDALWAIEAARAGARHVYAVEAREAVAARARQAVAEAGLAERVTVVVGRSDRITLPEPAQVCVSEIVGNIASAEGVIPVLDDARRRLCAPDCAWIPYRCETRVTAVDLSGAGRLWVASEGLPYLRRVFEAVGHPFDARMCLAAPVDALSATATVESLGFTAAGGPPAAGTCTVDLPVRAAGGRLTGLLLWPAVRCLADQPGVDALDRTTRGWAPVYAPVSSRGVPVRDGDAIRVTLARTPSDDGTHPDYTVGTELVAAGGGTRPLGTWYATHHGTRFRANDLYRHLFPEHLPGDAVNLGLT